MLNSVVSVTVVVDDLPGTIAAYRDWLGYRVIDDDSVCDSLAALWDAPAMAGAQCTIMRPESGDDFTLRFVCAAPTPGYAALTTHGWNAIEFLVQDPDAVAARLADSPFTIIGQPYDLTADGSARAMQAQGPGGEVIYLTRLSGDYAAFFGTARSRVDRAFIVVAGSSDHAALVAFYRDRLGQRIAPSDGFAIKVLSRALGLPPDTVYPLASARLEDGFSFELDGYPSFTQPRPRREGELPPGIAMVSASAADLDAVPLVWRAAPRAMSRSPYDGRRAGVTVGRGGEWLELVETGTGR